MFKNRKIVHINYIYTKIAQPFNLLSFMTHNIHVFNLFSNKRKSFLLEILTGSLLVCKILKAEGKIGLFLNSYSGIVKLNRLVLDFILSLSRILVS